MSEYLSGSEWRRWDLHIHTPGTLKNDLFLGRKIEEKWETFYSDIATYIGDGSNPTKNIVAIGITDYLSIDNYKKVITDNKLTGHIKLILPNVEMRMYPLSRQNGINIHFLFDPSIASELDDRFFSQLSISHGGRNYTATRSQLLQLGKTISSELNDDAAYKKGVGQFLPSFDNIKSIFDKDIPLREKTIVVVSNSSNDGVSGAANHCCYFDSSTIGSDFDATRQAIYQFSDAIFSANNNDIDYFIGKKSDKPDIVIEKCGSLKPCLHGCDAHTNSTIFEPSNKRYCWIKSDPTFNGLRQVLYEPKERVRILELKPEVKPSYYVIDRIEIEDENFQSQPIVFSDKLTCIIGGKSTGKSILLHNLALAIDQKQVIEKVKTAKSNVKVIDKVKVFWSDGAESSVLSSNDSAHKIVYIPQTYLNRLSDGNEEVTEIDNIIRDIVLINQDAKQVYDDMQKVLKDYKPSLDKAIYDLLAAQKDAVEIEAEKKELGTEPGIINELMKLKFQKDELSKELLLSEEDIKSYDEAVANIRIISTQIEIIKSEMTFIEGIDSLVEAKQFSFELSEQTKAVFKQAVEQAVQVANLSWSTSKVLTLKDIREKESEMQNNKGRFEKVESDLHDKVSGNNAISAIVKNIQTESEKLKKFHELDAQHFLVKEKYDLLVSQVVDSMRFYKLQHDLYAGAVNSNAGLSTNDLEFSVDSPFRKDAFCDKIRLLCDKRTLKTIINVDEFSVENYTQQILTTLLYSILDGSLPVLKNNTTESVLRDVLTDWYNTTYSVKMDGDSIEFMSPGKKALVLLKLLINLADSKCPILIDQPEDDLDNRSIFYDLIPFIKQKKIDRQIIVATHNANIVLGSDSDSIIVANQQGSNSPNKAFRFEYRSGAIEDNQPTISPSEEVAVGTLNLQGIQQHICDILEGGQKAFELRKHKYHI